MNPALDHSTILDKGVPGMDGQRDRQRADSEPRGFLPRAGDGAAPWRRVVDWLFGDRENIDQEGLLAERTLPGTQRRNRSEEPGERCPDPRSDRPEARN